MSHESRKTRYRKKRSWILYVLFFAVIGSTGLFFYPAFSKKFLREKEKSEISQTRWLYWCAGSPEAGDRPCYYVNREGLVVEGAPQLKGELFPKLYDEREGEKRIIEERLLAFVSHFYALGRFVVKNDDTLEIGWPGAMQLKVSLKDNPQEAAKNLALILEKEIGDRRDKVDYIDLRFGNRVYYKLKN